MIPAMLVAVSSNRGAAYDLVLLAHVLTAFVGFGAVGVAGISALALSRRGASTESLRRYYRPGVNWAGRILFGVPVLGAVLLVMSHGAWSWTSGWVTIGLILWAGAAMTAEMVLWPAERGLQQLVSSDTFEPEQHRGLALRVVGVSAGLVAVFVVATVVMVAKP